MQTMAKKDTLEHFKPDEFDTIIIDEVHRAGADSYQRIIQYLQNINPFTRSPLYP